jgi:multidrug efflux pump subunit AcrA (membrane-fusion protein)
VLLLPRDNTLPVPGSPDQVRAFVVADGAARIRTVKVSPVDGATLAVVEGLKEGDALVTSDLSVLADGLPVSLGK